MALLGCTSATGMAYLAGLDRAMIRDGLAGCYAQSEPQTTHLPPMTFDQGWLHGTHFFGNLMLKCMVILRDIPLITNSACFFGSISII